MACIEIGNLEANKGERTQGYLEIARRADGNPVHIPIIIICGVEEGPVLCVDGSTHGDEYEGVEAIMRLGKTLDPNSLRGIFIGVPIVNILAYETREREYPFDRYAYADINRCYPGREGGSITERIAYKYFNEVVLKSNFLLTFHGGGNYYLIPPKIIYPEIGDAELDKQTFDLARSFGVDILCKNSPHKGTLTSQAVRKGIPCACPEIGGSNRAPQDREDYVQLSIRGIQNTLMHLGMLEGQPEIPEHCVVVEAGSYIYCNNGGLMVYEPTIKLKARIKSGELIGKILDPLGGEVERVYAQWDGIVVLLRTMPVVNPGDWFIGIGNIIEEV